MIKRLIWTIWTPMSSVLKKADKLNLSLSLSMLLLWWCLKSSCFFHSIDSSISSHTADKKPGFLVVKRSSGSLGVWSKLGDRLCLPASSSRWELDGAALMRAICQKIHHSQTDRINFEVSGIRREWEHGLCFRRNLGISTSQCNKNGVADIKPLVR